MRIPGLARQRRDFPRLPIAYQMVTLDGTRLCACAVDREGLDRGEFFSAERRRGECRNILLELRHAACSNQCGSHLSVSEYPRERQLRQSLPSLCGDVVQGACALQIVVV